jgi:hypothetical protein
VPGRSDRRPAWIKAPLVLVLLAAVLLPSTTAMARAPESQRYVVGVMNTGCLGSVLAGIGTGSVCFVINKDQMVSISISDDAGLDTAGTYVFQDGSSNTVGTGTFCKDVNNLKVPAAAVTLAVYAYVSTISIPPTSTGQCVETPSLSGIVNVFYGPVGSDGGQSSGSRSASDTRSGSSARAAFHPATASPARARGSRQPARPQAPFPL